MAKKSIRVEVDEALHTKVKYKALTQLTTIAEIVREKLRQWVEEEHPIVLLPTVQPDQK